MREVIAISFLFIPLIWEIIDDSRVEKNHKVDVFIRGGLMLVCAVGSWYYGHSYWASVALSFAIFFLMFDYFIHIVMLRRKDFFSYLGNTSTVDKIKLWVKLGAWGRFAVRSVVFFAALWWYWY